MTDVIPLENVLLHPKNKEEYETRQRVLNIIRDGIQTETRLDATQLFSLYDIYLMMRGEHPRAEYDERFGKIDLEQKYHNRPIDPEKWNDQKEPNDILYSYFSKKEALGDFMLLKRSIAIKSVKEDIENLECDTSGDVEIKNKIEDAKEVLKVLNSLTGYWILLDGQHRVDKVIIEFFENKMAYAGREVSFNSVYGKHTIGGNYKKLFKNMPHDVQLYIQTREVLCKIVDKTVDYKEAMRLTQKMNNQDSWTDWILISRNPSRFMSEIHKLYEKSHYIRNFVESNDKNSNWFGKGSHYYRYRDGHLLMIAKLAWLVKHGYTPDTAVLIDHMERSSDELPTKSNFETLKSLFDQFCRGYGYSGEKKKSVGSKVTFSCLPNWITFIQTFVNDKRPTKIFKDKTSRNKHKRFLLVEGKVHAFFDSWNLFEHFMKGYKEVDGDNKFYSLYIPNEVYTDPEKREAWKQLKGKEPNKTIKNPTSYPVVSRKDTPQDFTLRIDIQSDFMVNTPKSVIEKASFLKNGMTFYEYWIDQGFIVEKKPNYSKTDEEILLDQGGVDPNLGELISASDYGTSGLLEKDHFKVPKSLGGGTEDLKFSNSNANNYKRDKTVNSETEFTV